VDGKEYVIPDWKAREGGLKELMKLMNLLNQDQFTKIPHGDNPVTIVFNVIQKDPEPIINKDAVDVPEIRTEEKGN
jgi:hypothetical protein